jgi:four helix bundle protein
MELAESSYRVTRTFPSTERFGITSQIRRAAVSIPSNIAEGHSRSTGDYLRYLLISRGSLTELQTQVELSVRLGFLSRDKAIPVLHRCDDVGRRLGSLRKQLLSKRCSPIP